MASCFQSIDTPEVVEMPTQRSGFDMTFLTQVVEVTQLLLCYCLQTLQVSYQDTEQ